jgi:hypothetical protein
MPLNRYHIASWWSGALKRDSSNHLPALRMSALDLCYRAMSALRPLFPDSDRIADAPTRRKSANSGSHGSNQNPLPASTISESWLPIDSEVFRNGNCNARLQTLRQQHRPIRY